MGDYMGRKTDEVTKNFLATFECSLNSHPIRDWHVMDVLRPGDRSRHALNIQLDIERLFYIADISSTTHLIAETLSDLDRKITRYERETTHVDENLHEYSKQIVGSLIGAKLECHRYGSHYMCPYCNQHLQPLENLVGKKIHRDEMQKEIRETPLYEIYPKYPKVKTNF
jgi:hypothetical protein